jgi:hypothetical protein
MSVTLTNEEREILVRCYIAERIYRMTTMDIEKKCTILMFDVLIKFDDEQLMKLDLI